MDPDATVDALFAADANPTDTDPDEVMDLLRALHGWVLAGGYVPEGAVAACTRMADRGYGFARTVARACNGGTLTHRGRTIRRTGDYKWIVDGWDRHGGYVSAEAAMRAIDRIDRVRID